MATASPKQRSQKLPPNPKGNPENFAEHPAVDVVSGALHEAFDRPCHRNNTHGMTYSEMIRHDARIVVDMLKARGMLK